VMQHSGKHAPVLTSLIDVASPEHSKLI